MGDFPETKEVHTCKGIVCDCKGEDKMTEEELIERIADIINEGAYRVDYSLRRVAYQILTAVREAGYKSPEEMKHYIYVPDEDEFFEEEPK